MPHTEGPYAGATFALLTMHEKERILAPRFSAELRARVVLAPIGDSQPLPAVMPDAAVTVRRVDVDSVALAVQVHRPRSRRG